MDQASQDGMRKWHLYQMNTRNWSPVVGDDCMLNTNKIEANPDIRNHLGGQDQPKQ